MSRLKLFEIELHVRKELAGNTQGTRQRLSLELLRLCASEAQQKLVLLPDTFSRVMVGKEL